MPESVRTWGMRNSGRLGSSTSNFVPGMIRGAAAGRDVVLALSLLLDCGGLMNLDDKRRVGQVITEVGVAV